jgi:hypothetical protein
LYLGNLEFAVAVVANEAGECGIAGWYAKVEVSTRFLPSIVVWILEYADLPPMNADGTWTKSVPMKFTPPLSIEQRSMRLPFSINMSISNSADR